MKTTKKFHVKLKNLKLQRFCKENDQNDKAIAIEIKWKASQNHTLLSLPFHTKSTFQTNRTSLRFLTQNDAVDWNDEFQCISQFPTAFSNIIFYVLSGDTAKLNTKLAVLGKASLNLADLLSNMETKIDRKLHITLMDSTGPRQAILSVGVSFVEVRDFPDSTGIARPIEQDKEGFLKVLKNLTSFRKKHGGSSDSAESGVFDSEDFPAIHGKERDEKQGNLFWKKRRLSFRHSQRKVEPLTEKRCSPVNDAVTVARQENDKDSSPFPVASLTVTGSQAGTEAADFSAEIESQYNEGNRGSWEARELVSRDGKSKLKTEVFFGSFDQCSEKAAGESACTAIVAVITHWLLSNEGSMPSQPELDSLIMEGSSEWQKLCNDTSYSHSFPNKHFDLETVVGADIRPISVSPEKSFVGFFHPEKFSCLTEAMSFDQIWNEINTKTAANRNPSVYIVSWNDHFFVLKMDEDACYVVDSLGERLFEGCNQAYMLRFNSSSLMFDNGEKGGVGELVCSGKECCREFFERFLAAITIEELEEEQRKITSSNFIPHQRLQIDFHFSSLVSPSSTNSSCSLFSDKPSSFNSSFEYM